MSHKAAVKVFIENNPQYVVCAENARILGKEIERLVEKENYDPNDVATYERAYCRVSHELQLNPFPEQKKPEDMTNEELYQLPEAQKERLSTVLTKRLAEFEFQLANRCPKMTDEQEWVKSQFEDIDCAYTPGNCKLVTDWILSKGLELTPQNIRTAIVQVGDQLEPSESYVRSLSADAYRREVVEPELRKSRAAQPKPRKSHPARR